MEYPLIGGAILLAAAGVAIYDHIQPESPDPTTLDGLTELHARGDISDAKYNRRRDVLLREEQDIGTYRWFQEIDGVGPETAFRLADHFETMTDVRAADRSEFEAVHNVGDSIAGAIEQKRADEHPIHES
jgi:ERCC4-type nuclease